VPVGVTGELYISGAGVARGYLNRPELTAERFLADPFSSEPGARMYKTGDLGRWLADGNIEYIGRNDFQVKIRGFRIELGEIEARLAECAGVREAVVVAREDTPGEKRLVGYVVLETGVELSPGVLREQLQQALPEYMVPSAFVKIEALPLTPNGKLDRRALPLPDISAQLSTMYVAPQTELTKELCTIWERILNLERVGVNDNFFSLGGDSIRSIQVVHAAAKKGLPVTLSQLFEHQTVATLAQAVSAATEPATDEQRRAVEMKTPVVNPALLSDTTIEDVYPLSSMQKIMVHQYSANASKGAGIYHVQQSFHICDEQLSSGHLKEALKLLVKAHSVLRTVFLICEGVEPVQVVLKHVSVALQEQDISGLNYLEQERLIENAMLADRRNPFDTHTKQPLFRFFWFKRSSITGEFFMAIHHAIDDGWGNIVFLEQLLLTYLSLKRGDLVVPLAARNVHKEFVALEIAATRAGDHARHWGAINLPQTTIEPHRYASDCTDSDFTPLRLEMDARIGGRIREACRRLEVSQKSFFLTCYLKLIEQQTGERRNTVGVVVNGRSEKLSDPFNSLGLFWNLVPFCPREPIRNFATVAKHVHTLLIDAERAANYCFWRTSSELHAPELFFATFNFVNFHHSNRLTTQPEIKVLGVRSRDKFHYPLNCAVALSQATDSASVTFEYDHEFFPQSAIEHEGREYLRLLEAALSEIGMSAPTAV
jgi:aryl carrier-like protein